MALEKAAVSAAICKGTHRDRERLALDVSGVLQRRNDPIDRTANAVRFPLCVNRGVDETAFCVVETIDLPTHLTDDCIEHRRSEEHPSELQSLMRTTYAVFWLKTKNKH